MRGVAQTACPVYANIVGVVTDSSGSAVVSAAVTIRDNEPQHRLRNCDELGAQLHPAPPDCRALPGARGGAGEFQLLNDAFDLDTLDPGAWIASQSLERYAAISVAPSVAAHTEILGFGGSTPDDVSETGLIW
jgi:hypothetical protein